jgi:hypothetical protein
MAELKTKPTNKSVAAFIGTVDRKQRADAAALTELMHQATGQKPRLWGKIVGFGQYHYVYDSGHEGDTMLVGFAPRKTALTLYVLNGFPGQAGLLEKLGKHKTGKGCLYINKLDDVHLPTLKKVVVQSFKQAKRNHKPSS